MDHLPRASAMQRFDVDFCTELEDADVYVDDGDFIHFPKRYAKSLGGQSSVNLDCFGIEPRKFLICWLYFQLLLSRLAIRKWSPKNKLKTAVADFTTTSTSGTLVLQTANLLPWLEALSHNSTAISLRHPRASSRSPNTELSQSVRTLHYKLVKHYLSRLSPGQILAIILLSETLDHFQLSGTVEFSDAITFRDPWGLVAIPAIEQQAEFAIGCVNRVQMARLRYNWSCLTFAGSLQYPPLHKTHARCVATKCRACDIDLVNHHPRHLETCSGCANVGPSLELLEQLIVAGEIPLVRLDSVGNGRDLVVESLHVDTRYVAMSHVWSQLFGHDLGNFLPLCQLGRLASWAQSLRPIPTHMWLDIICVPRVPVLLRTTGIAQIKSVIQAADHVLVLDEALIQSTASHQFWEETLIRICISQWMRRLWTLHEAVLARNLSFQFANGPFYLNSMMFHEKVDDQNLRHNVVGALALSHLQDPARLCHEPDGAIRMARLWNMLRWRSTSWPEQETICLFNMLHAYQDVVEPMSDISVHSRMEHFLRMYDQFPAELLFMDGPRLSSDGFGWSPLSWLTREETPTQQRFIDTRHTNVGLRTSAGLNVNYSGSCFLYSLREFRQNNSRGTTFRFLNQSSEEVVAQAPDDLDDRAQRMCEELADHQVAVIYHRGSGKHDQLGADKTSGALVVLRLSSDSIAAEAKSQKPSPVETRFICTMLLEMVDRNSATLQCNDMNDMAEPLSVNIDYHASYWCVG